MSESILERRKALLRQRLLDNGLAAAAPEPKAVRRDAGDRHPLSAGQRRMWFVQTRDPKDTTLNVCVAYRLVGAVDLARVRKAFSSVVARHEVLRTTYHVGEDGEPYQVSRTDAELDWQEHDLSDLSENSRARRFEVLARREFGRPFDLTADVPLRVTVARFDENEVGLALVAHHVAWDDDSWTVFFAEVNAAYNGGTAPAELRGQYVDVEVVDGPGEPAESDVNYWRQSLSPLPEPLELPGQRAFTATTSKHADRCSRYLAPELVERVKTTARQRGATPYMVLLAAFDALIHRYTASSDFVVILPVTNRRGPDAEALIGYFGNSLLVRSDFDRTDSFEALVTATRDACIGAFAHQHVGLDTVIRELNPERGHGRDGLAQLVQVSFSARTGADGFALDGVESSLLEVGSAVTHEPLGLMVVFDEDGGAHIEAEYLVDVMERPLVEDMLANYVQLLDSALADPQRRIADIDMLSAAGRADIVAASHGELIESPATTLTALVEAQASTTPANVAILSDTESFTYAEMNARANRLAHWLIGETVGPEDIVALKFETSVEFVIAAIAVLKSGAAYLPIDPAYPDGRIEYLIEDARPELVIDLAAFAEAERDAASLSDANPTDADRTAPLHPSNLAYVIYTSGSTGRPKGVPVPHGAIAEHLEGFVAEWGMTAEDRLLQSSSVSFDASLLDIFVTLTLGARLVVPKPHAFRDIPYVAELITRQGVTVLHMVPSMLSSFLLLPEVHEWRALRHVPVGGETLAGEVTEKFATIFDAELRNHYGPTEAVVCATHYSVDGPQGTRIVPIGTPNRNVYVYVLDHALQLVPAGVVGEIYLGGEQLARGYLNRPELTSERFVADPFLPGARLYRTGDLARRNSDGDIEFVGRSDEQVKIRGFRIELGEVEAVVGSHPSVGHCVVVAAETDSVGTVLAAYVVPASESETVVPEQLRAAVAAVLPEHMVPSSFAVIDEIPLTAHGKLDRRALPAPVLALAREYREPQTPTEIRVAALYSRIFGKDQIGADDSFFELGGHSLLAARLVTQIRAEFGLDIDVRVPFDSPTVSGLAARLVEQFRDEFDIDLDDGYVPAAVPSSSGRPPLAKHERPELIPLSYSQLAMWFQHRMEGGSATSNLSFSVEIDGPLDQVALTAAVGDVVTRHEALRTVFPERDGIPYQVVRPVEPVALPVTVLESADQVDAAVAQEMAYLFDLGNELLVRAHLFQVDDTTHVLSVVAHHIVTDHASSRVFLADLTTAYRSRLQDKTPAWSTPEVQYPDYALWQRELFDHQQDGEISSFGRAQFDYWRGTLAGLPDEITVAHDRPRPPVLGKTGEIATFDVSPTLRDGLKTLAEEIGVSEFMLCQSAVVTLLHKLGAGDDIAVGTPASGRVDEATDDLVGLFANMVVLRNDVSGNPSLRTVLERGRNTVLGAYSNQEVPIERLVEAINPVRTRSRNPLFQAMVHFRELGETLELTDTAKMRVRAAEFDISFLDINIDFSVDATGGLAARVVIAADLYDHSTAEMFAAGLHRVLEAIVASPDSRVRDIDVLPDNERRLVLDEWSKGSTIDSAPAVSGVETIGDLLVPSASLATLAAARNSIAGGDVRVVAVDTEGPESAVEVLAAKAAGTTVVLATDAERTDPAALAKLIGTHQATEVVADPEVLAQLAHSGVSMMPSVRRWVANGLTGPASLSEVLGSLSADSITTYRYGKPETLGAAVHGPVDGGRRGRPVPAGKVLVLDTALKAVPHGVDGEVYVGGAALALGYASDPARTATSFVADPYATGGLLFRTGDRARWDANGALVFTAAASEQVARRSGSGGDGGPATDTERVLIEILEELLDIDDVGSDDGFFALGGDSVISIQWSARANQLNLPLTPQMVFEYFTITELAFAVDQAIANPADPQEDSGSTADEHQHEPMSASGLNDDALAALTASWQARS